MKIMLIAAIMLSVTGCHTVSDNTGFLTSKLDGYFVRNGNLVYCKANKSTGSSVCKESDYARFKIK